MKWFRRKGIVGLQERKPLSDVLKLGEWQWPISTGNEWTRKDMDADRERCMDHQTRWDRFFEKNREKQDCPQDIYPSGEKADNVLSAPFNLHAAILNATKGKHKNKAASEAAMHGVIREYANEGRIGCTRKPGKGPEMYWPEAEKRDCELGTVSTRFTLARKEVTTQIVACEMHVYYRLDVCATCCCKEGEMVKTIMNTALAPKSKPNKECKVWFTFFDGLARSIFGMFKGGAIISTLKRPGCLNDQKMRL